ncbi:MAG: hypothetical protein ACE5ID_10660 [Acidobacteriota bacterium]
MRRVRRMARLAGLRVLLARQAQAALARAFQMEAAAGRQRDRAWELLAGLGEPEQGSPGAFWQVRENLRRRLGEELQLASRRLEESTEATEERRREMLAALSERDKLVRLKDRLMRGTKLRRERLRQKEEEDLFRMASRSVDPEPRPSVLEGLARKDKGTA